MRFVKLVVALAACVGGAGDAAETGETGDTGAPATGPTGAGYAEPACAPNDGLAVRIVVGIEGEGCEADIAPEHVRIAVWERAPLAPGTYPIDAATGQYWYSAGDGFEVYGTTGSLLIEAWDAEIVGAYSARLDGGEDIAGTFRATWCELDPRCG